MTSTAHSSAPHTRFPGETGDLFNSQFIWLVLILLVLLTIGTVVAIGAIYYGDEIAVPSWNERSMPLPRTGSV